MNYNYYCSIDLIFNIINIIFTLYNIINIPCNNFSLIIFGINFIIISFLSIYYIINPKKQNKLYQFLFICFLLLYYFYYNNNTNNKKHNKNININNCFMMILNIIVYSSLYLFNLLLLFIIKCYKFYNSINNYNRNENENQNQNDNEENQINIVQINQDQINQDQINQDQINQDQINQINQNDINNIEIYNNYDIIPIDLYDYKYDIKKNYDECVICLDPLISELSMLDCKHIFHKSCIKKWSKQQRFCPMCKTDF